MAPQLQSLPSAPRPPRLFQHSSHLQASPPTTTPNPFLPSTHARTQHAVINVIFTRITPRPSSTTHSLTDWQRRRGAVAERDDDPLHPPPIPSSGSWVGPSSSSTLPPGPRPEPDCAHCFQPGQKGTHARWGALNLSTRITGRDDDWITAVPVPPSPCHHPPPIRVPLFWASLPSFCCCPVDHGRGGGGSSSFGQQPQGRQNLPPSSTSDSSLSRLVRCFQFCAAGRGVSSRGSWAQTHDLLSRLERVTPSPPDAANCPVQSGTPLLTHLLRPHHHWLWPQADGRRTSASHNLFQPPPPPFPLQQTHQEAAAYAVCVLTSGVLRVR